MKNPFRAFDKQVKVLPQHQVIRDSMIKLSGWQKSDGDFPGHFKTRSGHKCIWTARWSTGSFGILTPDDWFRITEMKGKELIAEAEDILARYPNDFRSTRELAPLMTAYYKGQTSDRWIDALIKAIIRQRGYYGEYVFQPDPPPESGPGMLINPVFRPGDWSPPLKTPTIETKKTKYVAGRAR